MSSIPFLTETADLARADPVRAVALDGGEIVFTVRHRRTVGVALHAGPTGLDGVRAHLRGLAPALAAAKPFRFVDPVSERAPDGPGFTPLLPGIDDAGADLLTSDGIRLPASVCWFETPLSRGLTLGLLVSESPDGLRVNDFFRHDLADPPQIQFCCYTVTLPTVLAKGADGFVQSECLVHDPYGHFARYRHAQSLLTPESEEALTSRMVREPGMAAYFALVLASNRKRIQVEKASATTNRIRSGRGAPRIPDYHVVTLPDGWRPGSVRTE